MSAGQARRRADLLHILRASLNAVNPATLLREAIARTDMAALRSGPLFVVAAGKAAWPMACAFAELYGWPGEPGDSGQPLIGGFVAGPRGRGELPAGLRWFDASHPSPNHASEAAGRAALAGAADVGRDGRLLVLLSGGASSLMAVPADGLRLEDKVATADVLMKAGVAIDGLNCVRKHLSAIKGGRLAAAAGRSLTLAISDVHGPMPDDPSVIGSGPTVGDPTTFAEAMAVVRGADAEAVPPRVLEHLRRGVDESPFPGDIRLAHAEYRVIGTRQMAMAGAARAAAALGYAVHVVSDATTGEARVAGAAFAGAAANIAGAGKTCVIASGETTVRVVGTGRGGRNQEFVLGAIPVLADSADRALASVGTDGIDGPTDAAGAVADHASARRARDAGLDAGAALADNASYEFFRALDDLIVWGPTGTNVGDVHIMVS